MSTWQKYESQEKRRQIATAQQALQDKEAKEVEEGNLDHLVNLDLKVLLARRVTREIKVIRALGVCQAIPQWPLSIVIRSSPSRVTKDRPGHQAHLVLLDHQDLEVLQGTLVRMDQEDYLEFQESRDNQVNQA